MNEWDAPIDTRVIDQRHDSKGRAGRVIACDRLGHFTDPYYLASVRWDSGSREHDINTSWLSREDEDQEHPSA